MEKIKLLSIPFDFGQDHSGVRLATCYLKEQGLLEVLSKYSEVQDLGEMKFSFKALGKETSSIKHKRQCFAYNKHISEKIASLNLTQSFLINIGGDHGLGLGSVHGILEHDPETIIIWADAHGDINTPETSPSGNFHGMPLAFLLGLASDPDFTWENQKLFPRNLIFFGPRDLDQGEKEIIERLGIQYFSSHEINRLGSKEVLEMALHRADPFGNKSIHLSLDIDLFDSTDIRATGTRVAEGPRLEEVFLMGGFLGETGRLRSMDIVEFNPLIGNGQEVEDSSRLILHFLDCTLEQVFAPKFVEEFFVRHSHENMSYIM